jgi:hypothetical protein
MTPTPAQLRELVEKWKVESNKLAAEGCDAHECHQYHLAASKLSQSKTFGDCIRDLEQLLGDDK